MDGRCQTSRAGGKMLNFMATGRIAENKTKYLVTAGKLSNHSLIPEDEVIFIMSAGDYKFGVLNRSMSL